MKYFLPLFSVILFNLTALAGTSPGGDNVDFSITGLTLTAGDETTFTYAFNLTNGGTSDIQGYNMKLTFSKNATLDAGDYFSLVIPAVNDVSQHIGPNQTLPKNVTYTATTTDTYLPVGTWYVLAEINYDKTIAETDYANNTVWSTNTIIVANYTVPFTTPPTISTITESSFVINPHFEPYMTTIYYHVQPQGQPAPNAAAMLAENALFPFQGPAEVKELGPAFTYEVYALGEFADGKVTTLYEIDVTTLGGSSPTIIINPPITLLALDATGENRPSAVSEYYLSGFYLTADVTVSTSGNFSISKDPATGFQTSLIFPATDFTAGAEKPVYVKYLADPSVGLKTGSISMSSTGAPTRDLPVSVYVYDPEEDNFNGLTSLDQTGWRPYNVTGSQIWSLADLETSGPNGRELGDDKAPQIDGSTNGIKINEDWLISPEIDFSGYTYEPTIRFKAYSSGQGPSLVLKYSATYNGVGDPRDATWFTADVEFPAVDSKVWKKCSVPILNQEGKIYFAFVYTSTATAASRWTLDDWSIADNLLFIPSNPITYEDVQVGSVSASQSFEIKLIGYGDVVVSVSEGYQVSVDNTTFSANVAVSEADANTGKMIYVRFAPHIVADEIKGTLTYTASDLQVNRQNLVGSSLNATAVAKEIASANFLYPNPTDGVVRIDMSSFYKQTGDVPVSVVNSMGATVAVFEAPAANLDIKLSNILTGLTSGMYIVTIQTEDAIYRNKVMKK